MWHPTQKGGAGKTTLTVLVASYLHYEMGYMWHH
jgi:cellulose biosynthesis protein BcsQ